MPTKTVTRLDKYEDEIEIFVENVRLVVKYEGDGVVVDVYAPDEDQPVDGLWFDFPPRDDD